MAELRSGDRCRVVAWPLAGDGRKLRAGSALLGPDGEVLAAARTVWITVARRAVAPSAGAES
jgi:acyl-CoA thioesterase FadM